MEKRNPKQFLKCFSIKLFFRKFRDFITDHSSHYFLSQQTSASIKERVVQLKLCKQVENTLQKAHNLRSQAWFQNQITGIREHTILTSGKTFIESLF